MRAPRARAASRALKTWRGLAPGVLACALAAPFLELDVATGTGFGAAALLGDATLERDQTALALRPGAEALGLDQLPEALLPLVLFFRALGIGALEIAAVALLFTIVDVLAAPMRHRR